MPAVYSKTKRDDLFREIVSVFRQWPELERIVFCQAHYHGKSVEAISRSLNLNVEEVHALLNQCDCQLNASLRNFRNKGCEKPSLVPAKTACSAARGQNLKEVRTLAPKVNHALHGPQRSV